LEDLLGRANLPRVRNLRLTDRRLEFLLPKENLLPKNSDDNYRIYAREVTATITLAMGLKGDDARSPPWIPHTDDFRDCDEKSEYMCKANLKGKCLKSTYQFPNEAAYTIYTKFAFQRWFDDPFQASLGDDFQGTLRYS
jgi:hypothetical protein